MNEVFSLRRWNLLLGRHWRENRKKYLLSLLGLGVLGFAVFILVLFNILPYRNFEPEEQGAIYFIGLFLCGCILSSMLFSDLGDKARGIMYLTLPASLLEKLLNAVFYALIIFPLAYTLIFYTLDVPAVKFTNAMRYNDWQERKKLSTDPAHFEDFRPDKVVNIFQAENWEYNEEEYIPEQVNYFRYLWAAFIAVQAFFALGSVWFGRFSFVKSSIMAFAIFLAFTLLSLSLYNIFNIHDMAEVSYSEVDNVVKTYRLPRALLSTELFLLQTIFAPLFWFISYLKLKEKEI